MPDCVAPATLRRYLDERLPAGEETAVAAHLATCPACRGAVDGLLRAPAVPVVPGYELLGKVGEGGMGVVYRARDVKLDRVVAVKVMRGGLAVVPDLAARLGGEARVTAALGEHPGIVPVTDAGELPGGRAFFVMKFVAGATFAARLADPARAPGADADLRVVERIARIVGYAHTRPGGGVAHRDLKPSNVLLSQFDEVFVADWGLSKWYAPGAGAGGPAAGGVTAAGHGTWAYMPPEQAAPAGRAIAAASDVFALGGILTEVLTGKPTYTADTPDGVVDRAKAADLGETFARLAASRADPELVALCRRCLSADPAARPPDGAAVADALKAYFARLDAEREGLKLAAARADSERRRRRWQLAGVAAAALALAAVPVVQVYRGEARRDRERAADARRQVGETIDDLDATLDRLRQGNDAAALRAVFDRLDRRVRAAAEVVGDSPELTGRRAKTLVRLAEACLETGDSGAAREHGTEAVRLYEALAAAAPENPAHREGLAAALEQLFDVYDVRWEDDACRAAVARARAVRQELLDRDPTDLNAQAALAKAEALAGLLAAEYGDYAAAAPLHRSALARRERVFAARPADSKARVELSKSHRLLAVCYDNLAPADGLGLGDAPARAARHGADARRLLDEVPMDPAHARDWERARAHLLTREMWAGDTPAARAAAGDLQTLADTLLARGAGGYFWEQRRADAEVRVFLLTPGTGRPKEQYREAAQFWARYQRRLAEWCRVDPGNRRWSTGQVTFTAYHAMSLVEAGDPGGAARELDGVAAEAGGLLAPEFDRTSARVVAAAYARARGQLAEANGGATTQDVEFRNLLDARAFYRRHAAREPDNRHWKLKLAESDRDEVGWLYKMYQTDPSRHAAGVATAEAAYVATRGLRAADPADPIAAAAHDTATQRYAAWLALAGRPELELPGPDMPSPLRTRAARVAGDRIRALEALAACHPGAPAVLRTLRSAEAEVIAQGRLEVLCMAGAPGRGPAPFRAAFGEPEDFYLVRTATWARHLTTTGNPFAPRTDPDTRYPGTAYFQNWGGGLARNRVEGSERIVRTLPSPSRRGELLDALLDLMWRERNAPGPERAWAAGRAVGLLAEWDERRVLDPYLVWWRPHVAAELAAAGPRAWVGHLPPDERALHAAFRYPELARRLVASDRAGVLFDLLLDDWRAADRAAPDDERWQARVMEYVTLDAFDEPGVGEALLAEAACWMEHDPDALPRGFRRALGFTVPRPGGAN